MFIDTMGMSHLKNMEQSERIQALAVWLFVKEFLVFIPYEAVEETRNVYPFLKR
jgi:hypothetical protein